MLRDQLRELLEPVVAGLGYELWELEYHAAVRRRVAADLYRFAGRHQLDDCERVSRAVSEALDAADPIPGHYTLEVSSPGLDRVLRTREHFARFAGERVRVEMMQPVDGRKRFAGRLLGVATSEITLEVEAAGAACRSRTYTGRDLARDVSGSEPEFAR